MGRGACRLLDAGGFDRRLHRVRLLVIEIERDQRVRSERDDQGEQRADHDRVRRPVHRRTASNRRHEHHHDTGDPDQGFQNSAHANLK